MQTSSSRGMQTMEQALADLVLRQIVDFEEALARTTRVEQLHRDPRARRRGRRTERCPDRGTGRQQPEYERIPPATRPSGWPPRIPKSAPRRTSACGRSRRRRLRRARARRPSKRTLPKLPKASRSSLPSFSMPKLPDRVEAVAGTREGGPRRRAEDRWLADRSRLHLEQRQRQARADRARCRSRAASSAAGSSVTSRPSRMRCARSSTTTICRARACSSASHRAASACGASSSRRSTTKASS